MPGNAPQRATTDDDAAAWLALTRTPGLGPVTLAELRAQLGSGSDVLDAGPERWHVEGGVPASRARAAFAHARGRLHDARRELRALRAAGHELLHPDHAAYPVPLVNLPDPPPVLYLSGTVPRGLREPFHASRGFAVVGTRRASAWGLAFADELGARLAAAGAVVVSGLAIGIDAAAHEGALRAGKAPTVAVLGSGLRRLHPARHLGLARRIVASGGALLSEHPPDDPARPRHFPRRNRIVAGLGRGVAVVEAGPRSGATITADLANEYGRSVYAVPRRPDLEVGRGILGLLCDGATPLGGAEQILAEFGWGSAAEERSDVRDAEKGAGALRASPAATRAAEAAGGAADGRDGPQRAIVDALTRRGSLTDHALAEAVPDASRLLASLTALELEERVHRDASGRWHLRTPRALERRSAGRGPRRG